MTEPAQKSVHKKSVWKTNNWVDLFLTAIRVFALLVIAYGLLRFAMQVINGESLSFAAIRGLAVTGLSQGAMYGLIALGYSMVYGVLGFINFAHGEVFMAGAMSSWITSNILFENGMWEGGITFVFSLIIVLVVAVLTSTLATILIERIAYRPLRESPRLIPLITSIGVSFFMQNAALGLFGEASKSIPKPPDWMSNSYTPLQIEGTTFLVLIVAAVSMAGLWVFVERTKTGKAMRAVAEDKEIAALMGIDVNRTIVTTFAVGGAMAGVAGVLWALLFRGVSAMTGFLPGIKAFTAAVIGGVGNLGGSMAGGLLLGMVESVGPLLVLEPMGIPAVSQLKDAVAFAVLVLVLLFKPTGLFGERLASEDRA